MENLTIISFILGVIIGLHFGIRLGANHAYRDVDKVMASAKKMIEDLKRKDVMFRDATKALCENKLDEFHEITRVMRNEISKGQRKNKERSKNT